LQALRGRIEVNIKDKRRSVVMIFSSCLNFDCC